MSSNQFTDQPPPLWSNGPRPGGGFYQLQSPSSSSAPQDPRQHTQQPIVTASTCNITLDRPRFGARVLASDRWLKIVLPSELNSHYFHLRSDPAPSGTSILAIKYDGGIMMAADTLGSYGSLARFRDERRLKDVGGATIIGGSGDLADYHHILHMLDDLVVENGEWEDGQDILPQSVHSYMTRVLYNRRTKMNPLWNTVVVGGFANGEGYLGYCDKIGVAYKDDVIATGYGSYIALPIMRRAYEENQKMTEAEARSLLERCLKVMYYRDARSLNRYQIASATATGVVIGEPESAETNWDIATMVKGYE